MKPLISSSDIHSLDLKQSRVACGEVWDICVEMSMPLMLVMHVFV